MGLNTIFGINGIGKDTVAEELRKRKPEVIVTSMSRVLMYILGISKTYDVNERISEKQYKKLESIPQDIMIHIENNEYRYLLEKMSKDEENVIFLAHLISVLRLGEEVKFLENRLTPDWFLDMNKNLIQLVAPVNLVKERREKDSSRKRQSDIVQILKHQKLCSEEWERIARKSVLTSSKMHVIENVDLNKAVNEIENIIYERDNIKSNRNEFIQRLKYQVTPIGDEKNNSLICTRKTDVSKNVKEERDGR